MKESIDCAVLMLPPHEAWMHSFIDACATGRNRLNLHALSMDGTRWTPGQTSALETWPSDALANAALQLRRYDVCLLPVTLETLGWTRLALANAAHASRTPIVGLSRDLKAAGLHDLLALGMAEFLRDPVCPEELKIRLSHLGRGSATPPRLADDAISAPAPRKKAATSHINKMVQELFAQSEAEPFRLAKARMVTEFERHYICSMLDNHHGNISQAAKAARKNRRAFWELMRKHEIAADRYRGQVAR